MTVDQWLAVAIILLGLALVSHLLMHLWTGR